jgi:hypothetical protein
MLTHERLLELLDYNQYTGVFTWRQVRKRGHRSGAVAGWHSGKGMWRIEVDGVNYLAHRLAFFYVYKWWPIQVDHKDGDRSHNWIANLRPADNSQNQANNGPKSNNRLGHRGIGLYGKWYVVQLKKNGIAIRAKFTTLDEAIEFVNRTSQEIHGEFSVFSRPEPQRKQ